jgi:hypothetical protein
MASFAQADDSGRARSPKLEYSRNNGTIDPRFRRTEHCSIENGMKYTWTISSDVHTVPTPHPIAWTNEIRDEDRLLSTIILADNGKVRRIGHGPGHDGGPATNYSASYVLLNPRKPNEVFLKDAQKVNITAAAAKLIRFIDYNCVKQ